MHGQFFVQISDQDKKKLSNAFTCIDADRDWGHFVELSESSGDTRVGALSFSSVSPSKVDVVVMSHPSYEEIYEIPPDKRLPTDYWQTVQLDKISADHFEGTWKDPSTGKQAHLILKRMVKDHADQPAARFNDWSDYKAWADRHVASGCAFRGQAYTKLVSSFHRTGRVDVIRYLKEDLPKFVEYMDTLTGRSFELEEHADLGAALGMAQHHGFPTPLLDWTNSPYVAAYFALAQVLEQSSPPEFVRVYKLSAIKVNEGLLNPRVNLIQPRPFVSSFRPKARGNARLLNQQGLFTYSNLADIDTLLRFNPGQLMEPGVEYIEISSKVARRAIADLRNMGTTAATLFPGLDGSATYVKHMMF
jgi:hypothetical protein